MIFFLLENINKIIIWFSFIIAKRKEKPTSLIST